MLDFVSDHKQHSTALLQ